MSNHLNITDGIFESASDYHDVTIASGATLELTGELLLAAIGPMMELLDRVLIPLLLMGLLHNQLLVGRAQ